MSHPGSPNSDGQTPAEMPAPPPLPPSTPPADPAQPWAIPSGPTRMAGGLFSAIRGAFSRKQSSGASGGSGAGGANKGPQVFVAGFGKHPGAEDHYDVGVATE